MYFIYAICICAIKCEYNDSNYFCRLQLLHLICMCRESSSTIYKLEKQEWNKNQK